MRTKEQVANEIKALVEELLMLTGVDTAPSRKNGTGAKTHALKTKDSNTYEGCMGGIMYLHDHGFFTSPKGRKEVIDELKREGWHYAPALVSMNLLALNRKRVLTRLPDEKKKGWVYVIRK